MSKTQGTISYVTILYWQGFAFSPKRSFLIAMNFFPKINKQKKLNKMTSYQIIGAWGQGESDRKHGGKKKKKRQ